MRGGVVLAHAVFIAADFIPSGIKADGCVSNHTLFTYTEELARGVTGNNREQPGSHYRYHHNNNNNINNNNKNYN